MDDALIKVCWIKHENNSSYWVKLWVPELGEYQWPAHRPQYTHYHFHIKQSDVFFPAQTDPTTHSRLMSRLIHLTPVCSKSYVCPVSCVLFSPESHLHPHTMWLFIPSRKKQISLYTLVSAFAILSYYLSVILLQSFIKVLLHLPRKSSYKYSWGVTLGVAHWQY